MQRVTYEFMEFDMCELIREVRCEKGISQDVLYQGLCNKKVYFQMESGGSELDDLLYETLLSRLHVQQRMFDVMLDDEEFDRVECRHKIDVCMKKEQWEQVEHLLCEYELLAPTNNLHQQYVLAKRAELMYQSGQEAGQRFKEALELTLPLGETEKRIQGSGVIGAEELWMYYRYRSCEKEFSGEEYEKFLTMVERCFLEKQIYLEVHFEAAYRYALMLCKKKEDILGREVAKKAIAWLKKGKKSFCLPQILFLDAIMGMRLRRNAEQEKELFQQCKQGYYTSLCFGKLEMAKKMASYCEEEFGWHIIGQVK